jgi:DNA gyrase/topoisomerase IV subunit B
MRPLIDDGRVFAAVPPLHRIELVGAKRGDFQYTYSDDEMRRHLKNLEKDPLNSYIVHSLKIEIHDLKVVLSKFKYELRVQKLNDLGI